MSGIIKSRVAGRMEAAQCLYSQEFTDVDGEDALRALFDSMPDHGDHPDPEAESFAWQLVLGVWRNKAAIDAVIEQNATNWRFDRIGRVELGVLRVAVYELLYAKEFSRHVIINDAVEIVRQFGIGHSTGFVTGVLSAVDKSLIQKNL
ncbi:MAG: transcription antitermination factor NusB [Mailhella sp.]|nr:transcription antitermination factor NusB [Mailhella sp.]